MFHVQFNCCFLTCIQVSQEAGQTVWYYHLFQNFPQFVIYTVKGFSIVKEAEVNVFLDFLSFFYELEIIFSLLVVIRINWGFPDVQW